jgi:uncharacterized OB-fold protein
MSDAPFRILPRITERNEAFWSSGQDGRLRFQRCGSCRYWIHPHSVLCPQCLGKDLAYEAVSGRAVVHTFALAIVELPEQEGLRLTTVIVHCPVDEVAIGMPVQVTFEAHEDENIWIPMFEPIRESQ